MKQTFETRKFALRTLMLLSITVLIGTFTMPSPRAAGQQSKAAHADSRWNARLEKLQPAQPMKYFELAEDIADAGETAAERDLARYLFALAGALDPDRLGRSAALALADMEADASVKRRLLALASLLGEGGGGHAGGAGGNDTIADVAPSGETTLTVCEALALYRRGRGPQALTRMDENGANAILKQYGDLLPGGYNQFMQDCRIYRNDLRPILSDLELNRMLRLEEALLAGDDRSWASDLLVNKATPLIEIDPTRVAETLKVNPEYCIYRGGRWVKAE